jgi:hypothetical protein
MAMGYVNDNGEDAGGEPSVDWMSALGIGTAASLSLRLLAHANTLIYPSRHATIESMNIDRTRPEPGDGLRVVQVVQVQPRDGG